MHICAICGTGRNVENAHIVSKGLGGDPAGNRAETVPLCAGTGGNTDPTSCHGAHHAGRLRLRRGADGSLWFVADEKYTRVLNRRGVRCKEGQSHVALYEHADADALDAPR